MATNTAAEITRVYDEPGPLEYHAGLWVECPGTGSVMSFGDPRVNGTKSRPRTLTIDSGTGVSTEETRSSTELSIPVTSGRARGGAGRVLVKLDTSSDVVIRQPVIIQLMIENRSGEALEFDLGDDQKANVQFQITRPDGVVTDVLRWRRGGLGGSVLGGRVVVPPLAVFTRQFLLDDWTTLDRPGQHAVRLAIDSIFRSSGGETLAGPVERTLMVRVGPRDDERLGRVCQRLAQLAIDGATAQDRGDAAHALAQVVDPIALPSVRRVLEATNWFDSGIARGLMRIGTDSARSLLDEMATSSQPERSSIARDTLRRWEAR
jgi:hypothetical protein